ncbi:esterase-like activity of phytase family protein [Halomonas sp. M20]|uniref:esterase-like activity of phytase family protein n=1 Tax=Halomonas sp. M20 TaxID=2763264 RepID=UPI001D0B3FA1|nr:esterase-like activity of phytase family protein [Halomonas sp. M20]
MFRLLIAASLFMLLMLTGGCAREARQTQLMTENTTNVPENVSWCGTLRLPGKWQDDTPVGGLSDLAWDEDESLLYMISDRGWLHRVRLRFSGGELIGLDPLKTYVLRDRQGRALNEDAADAESMIAQRGNNGVRGDTRLLIGFERDHRIQHFYPNGKSVGKPLKPQGLRGASPEKGVEAMGRHKREGIIAGLENAPTGIDKSSTRLFSLGNEAEWTYPLLDESGNALTALETYGNDLLALERAFAPPAPLVISLRRVQLGSNAQIEVKTLAQLSSGDGWRLDNFEGLTHLGGNRYLMVSDDNFRLVQETLLTCFELPSP